MLFCLSGKSVIKMLKKIVSTRNKYKLYDIVQYAWVSTCMAVTVAGSVFIGYNLYNYFMNIRPIKHELEERFKEELLKEGRALHDAAQTTST